MTTPLLPEMTPMRDISQIQAGDRLFYELGHKIDVNGEFGDNWVRTGYYKELEDVKSFVEGDKSLQDIQYLEHHNFMLIKQPQL